MTTKTDEQELLPCPFCGGGETEIQENGRPWLGTKWGEPVSVSVRHWCDHVDGQPSRMIERVGRDRAAAIDAWNRRADLQSQDREDAERYRTAFDLLKILFEARENGPACYNNGDRDEYIGNAFLLDDKTFHACVKVLSIDHARRVEEAK